MQADEFEKKIKDKMDEFELVPDSEVWRQVSIQINKQKKKRRAIVYWLLCGLAVLTGGFSLMIIRNENTKELTITKVKADSKKEHFEMKQKTNDLPKGLDKKQKSTVAAVIKSFAKNGQKHFIKAKTNSSYSSGINDMTETSQLSVSKENKLDNIGRKESLKGATLLPHRFYNPALKVKGVDSLEKNNKVEKTKDNLLTHSTAVKKEKKSEKWSFGFTVYGGISNKINKLPLLTGNYSQNNPSSVVPSGGLDYSGGNYSYYPNSLSKFRKDLSFGVGFFIKQQITKKLSISAGVDYHYYSAISTVGNKMSQQRVFYDSTLEKANAVNAYYVAGNSVSYSNVYHLLRLPINLEYQVNKNKQKPILLTAGISPGYMVSSNALYANPSANVYYVDKQTYERFQLSAQAGISFPIISFSSYSIAAGPMLEYGITSTSKAAHASNQHLFFTGIKANINLK